MKIEHYKISELVKNPDNRDIRPHIVEALIAGIEKRGYNPAAAISVKKVGGGNVVADGNHRLEALTSLGFKNPIPCVVYSDDELSIHAISANGNEAAGVMAPVDLFDKLDSVAVQKVEKLTHAVIAENMGFHVDSVKDLSKLISNVGANVLNFAKAYQDGRAPKKEAIAPFNFTEGWFRNSGIYTLPTHHNPRLEMCLNLQADFLHWFCIENKCSAKKKDIDKQVLILNCVGEQLEAAKEGILLECYESNDGRPGNIKNSKLLDFINDILSESFISKIGGAIETVKERFKNALKSVNSEVESKALFGFDCVEVLQEIIDENKKNEENQTKIGCVITDPPWGVNYIPSRDTGNPKFDKDLEETTDLLDVVFDKVKQVCVEDAHIYVFYPTVFQEHFYKLLSKYFDVDPIPLVWVKNNHTPCDFKNRHASKYENIFFCKMKGSLNREFTNGATPDVFECAKPSAKWHDCQKPIGILSSFIKNSTTQTEIILDPFAGSGSALLAAKGCGRNYIGIEKEEKYKDGFSKAINEMEGK